MLNNKIIKSIVFSIFTTLSLFFTINSANAQVTCEPPGTALTLTIPEILAEKAAMVAQFGSLTQFMGIQDFLQRQVSALGHTANKLAQDQIRSSIDLARQNANRIQNTEEVWARIRMGQAEIAKYNVESMPTLAQCVELTAKETLAVLSINTAVSTEAIMNAMDGSNSTVERKRLGGRANDRYKIGRGAMNSSESDTESALNFLKDKTRLQTCTVEEMLHNVNCIGTGANVYPNGDRTVKSLFKNLNQTTGKKVITQSGDTKTEVVVGNNSLDPGGIEVASKAILNLMSPFPSNTVPQEVMNKPEAGAFKTLFEALQMRTGVGILALTSIFTWRGAPTGQLPDLINKYWSAVELEDYGLIIGANKPLIPSEFEVLNFKIRKEFFNSTYNAAKSVSGNEVELLKDIFVQNSTSNYLGWIRIKQQEETNMLLSALLANNLRPITIEEIDKEKNRLIANGVFKGVKKS